jgi:hypothetical protein
MNTPAPDALADLLAALCARANVDPADDSEAAGRKVRVRIVSELPATVTDDDVWPCWLGAWAQLATGLERLLVTPDSLVLPLPEVERTPDTLALSVPLPPALREAVRQIDDGGRSGVLIPCPGCGRKRRAVVGSARHRERMARQVCGRCKRNGRQSRKEAA